MKDLVFVSSVQKELAAERRALFAFIRGDALLSQHFDVFLFEELPASDRKADDVYIEQVDRSVVYLGIFGNEYGREGPDGLSPTEREFDRATERRKTRLIFVRGSADEVRHPKMRKLIQKAERQLVRRRFRDVSDLTGMVYASLIRHLEGRGILHRRPFDAAACAGASLREVSAEKIEWFLRKAREERKFALKPSSSAEETLTHLNLLDGKRPSHAAMLLFGSAPQRFIPAAEVKCLHYHSTEQSKPIPSYQLFKGTVFDQVDQAVDFVMAKLARTVSARNQGPRAAVEYEIPRAVIAEAIVNAVAHRDYASNAGVQIYVFSDRVEAWNPGELPPSLTPEQLRKRHPSIPRNPLLCEALFLAHYIEKAGTGTLDVIAGCRKAGLPEPDFQQNGDQFVITLWRDWLTDAVLNELKLNDRQKKALIYVKTTKRLSNADYQRVTGSIKKTATRDLDDLVAKAVLEKIGRTGRGTHYVLSRRKGDKKGT